MTLAELAAELQRYLLENPEHADLNIWASYEMGGGATPIGPGIRHTPQSGDYRPILILNEDS